MPIVVPFCVANPMGKSFSRKRQRNKTNLIKNLYFILLHYILHVVNLFHLNVESRISQRGWASTLIGNIFAENCVKMILIRPRGDTSP